MLEIKKTNETFQQTTKSYIKINFTDTKSSSKLILDLKKLANYIDCIEYILGISSDIYWPRLCNKCQIVPLRYCSNSELWTLESRKLEVAIL